MNIFRLQLMVDLLKEMEESIPKVEVVGTISTGSHWNKTHQILPVTRVIDGFSLDTWTNAIGDNANEGINVCGYTACAIGHAMLDVRFNALGFIQMNGIPLYRGRTNWPAVMDFFDVEELTAEIMFQDEYYPNENINPLQVAKRVQELVMVGEADFKAKYRDTDGDY